jgi:hypothetical protein
VVKRKSDILASFSAVLGQSPSVYLAEIAGFARLRPTSCDKCSAYLRGYERTIQLAEKTRSNSAVSAVLPENLVRKIMATRRS